MKEYDANTGLEISLTDTTQLKGGCNVSQTKATIYAVSTTDLTGTLPLCFYDADTNNTLKLYQDVLDENNRFPNNTTTYSASTAATPNKVNVNYTFPQTFNT